MLDDILEIMIRDPTVIIEFNVSENLMIYPPLPALPRQHFIRTRVLDMASHLL